MLSRLEMAERTVEENRKPHPAKGRRGSGRGRGAGYPWKPCDAVLFRSAAASRVKKAGDAPDIVKDDITKVTLFDYSDIISGDVDDMEE